MPDYLRQVYPEPLVNDPPVEYKKNGFVSVPNDWVSHMATELSSAEVKLVLLLARYQGGNEWGYPSQKTLAANMNQTTRGIRKLLTSLKSKKQIKEKKRPGKTTHYQVTWRITQGANNG